MYFIITTFGCKVNQYESMGLSELMKQNGFTETGDIKQADIHIINSCTVTENSDRKVISYISKIKNSPEKPAGEFRPSTIIVLCGCFPEAFPEKAKKTGADIITGVKERLEIPERIKQLSSYKLQDENYKLQNESYKPFSPQKNRTRAFLKIQEGALP